MVKSYQVFYIIKKNNKEELNHMFVYADNQKEAIRKCREQVKLQKGKNAFRATTKKPFEVTTTSGRKILTI